MSTVRMYCNNAQYSTNENAELTLIIVQEGSKLPIIAEVLFTSEDMKKYEKRVCFPAGFLCSLLAYFDLTI